MARDNEQWKHFQENNEVLVIFMGPHAYISPSIYEGPGVPTWNYAVIHMYGSARIIEDHTSLKGIIEALSDKYEISQNRPAVDRRNIINNLLDSGQEGAAGVARLMEENEQS